MLYFIMGRDEILFSKYRVEVIAGAFVLGLKQARYARSIGSDDFFPILRGIIS